jgi:hypothetical protein
MRAAKRRIPPAKAGTEAGFLESDHAARHRRHDRGLAVGATHPRVFGARSSVVERGNNGLAIHSLTPGLTDAPSRQGRGFARLIPWIRDCKIGETSGPRLEPLAVLLVDRCGTLSTVARGGSGASQRFVVSNQGSSATILVRGPTLAGCLRQPRGILGQRSHTASPMRYETMPRLLKGGNSKCKADSLSQSPGDGNNTNRDVS